MKIAPRGWATSRGEFVAWLNCTQRKRETRDTRRGDLFERERKEWKLLFWRIQFFCFSKKTIISCWHLMMFLPRTDLLPCPLIFIVSPINHQCFARSCNYYHGNTLKGDNSTQKERKNKKKNLAVRLRITCARCTLWTQLIFILFSKNNNWESREITFTCTNHESKFPRAVNSTPRRMTSKNFVMLPSQRLLAGNGFIAEKDEFLTQKAQKEKSKFCYMSCDPEVIKESARCWGKDPATFNFISFAGNVHSTKNALV